MKEAVAKFQHLITSQERELRYLHEKIALLTNEGEAQAVTGVDRPAPDNPTWAERAKQADEVGDAVVKWGGRAIQFAPWLMRILAYLKT